MKILKIAHVHFALIFIGLVGCVPPTNETMHPVSPERPTSSLIDPSGTPEPPHMEPTKSKTPTATLTPRPGTPTIPPTLGTQFSLMAQACDSPWNFDWSPDKQWIAVSCIVSFELGDLEVVINNSGDIKWPVYLHEVFRPSFKEGPFEGHLTPIHWSADGRFLYISASISVDPGFLLANGLALYRLDLTNGAVSEIIHPQSWTPFAFSFSPRSRFLAYSPHYWEPFGIYIMDVLSGEVEFFKISEPYELAGDFAWSPDTETLVFKLGVGHFFEYTIRLAVMDLQTGLYDVLPDDVPDVFRTFKWISNTLVEFHANFGFDDNEPIIWLLDIDTLELIKESGDG